MLLSYLELVKLVESGVINAPIENINGASIDVTLDDTILVEDQDSIGKIVDLSRKQFPSMKSVVIDDEGYALEPGQFVLASTREIFNLPNDIACEFKLKSSAARAALNNMLATWCFVGDTKIPLIDGSVVDISDIDATKNNYVYSLDDNGEVVPGRVINSGVTGIVKDTVKITLDSGGSFECTPEHSIMMRNGKYKEASALCVGESLMPLYRRTGFYGHEEVYCPSLVLKGCWKNPKGKWRNTHKIVYKSIFGSVEKGNVIHHKDHCKGNNHPSNLCQMDATEHLIHHSKEAHEISRLPENREKSSKHASALCGKLWNDDVYKEFREKKNKSSSEKMKSLNLERWSSDENKKAASEWAKENNVVSSLRKYQADNPGISRTNAIYGKLKKNISRMIESGISIDEQSYIENKGQSAPSLSSISEVFGSFEKALESIGYMNHKVLSVEMIRRDNTVPVYDITVEKYHNFALDSGVFVHNCDPGWHNSKLTLELQNCLQYQLLLLVPGMKIGQMVFYRVQEVPELNSYAVKGRYNHTMEVTASKGV